MSLTARDHSGYGHARISSHPVRNVHKVYSSSSIERVCVMDKIPKVFESEARIKGSTSERFKESVKREGPLMLQILCNMNMNWPDKVTYPTT
jgi:hypothetical protein